MKFHRFVATSVIALMALTLSTGIVSAAPKASTPKAKASQKTPAGKININTASAEQLSELPGVGAKLAARIVEHRQKQGPFKTTQELMNVKGVGEKNFAKLQSYLSIGETAARGTSR